MLGSDRVIEVLRPKSIEREREMQRVLKETDHLMDEHPESDDERPLPEDAGEIGGNFVDKIDEANTIPEDLEEQVKRLPPAGGGREERGGRVLAPPPGSKRADAAAGGQQGRSTIPGGAHPKPAPTRYESSLF